MKKLRLKREVVEHLKSENVLGGDRTTTYGDSGGTLCHSCNFCPDTVLTKPIKISEGCTTSVVVCC